MPRVVKTIRAIFANAGVENWYRSQLDGLVLEAHLELTRIASNVAHAAAEATPATARPARVFALAQDASSSSDLDRQLKAWAKKWQGRTDKAAEKIAASFASRAFRMTDAQIKDALKQAGFIVDFKPSRKVLNAAKAATAENVQLIKSIPAQYLTNVQSAVWASVRQGGDMSALSKRLTEEYGVTVRRAALIARDQNNKTKAMIENVRRAELGITHAIWQHSAAGREPRPTHVAFDGVMFPLSKGMYDKDEQRYVLPGELINCRCTSRAVIPGFNDDEV